MPTSSVTVQPPAPAAHPLLPAVEVTVSLAAEAKLAPPGCPCPPTVGFHRLGSKTLFQAERQIAEFDGGRLVLRPETLRGLPTKGFTPITFFGDWPTSAWVQLREHASWEAGHSRGVLFQWVKDHFQRVKATDVNERYDAWFAGNGAVGAIVHSFQDGSSTQSVVSSLDKAQKTPVPRLSLGNNGEQRLAVLASGSLPSGQLFVLGTDRNVPARDVPMVERFGPGEETGKLEALPLPPNAPPRLEWSAMAVRSPSDVYVAGVFGDPPEHMGPVVSYLAHFDGTTWRSLDMPQGLWAPQAALGEDGTLWILNDTPQFNPTPPETFTSQLLRRSPTGQWAQIRLRTASGSIGGGVILSRLFVQARALWLVTFPEAHRDQLSVWSTEPVTAVLKMSP